MGAKGDYGGMWGFWLIYSIMDQQSDVHDGTRSHDPEREGHP